MKKYTLLLVSSLLLSSCYSYKVYEPETAEQQAEQNNNSSMSVRESFVRTAREAKSSANINQDVESTQSKDISSRNDNTKNSETTPTGDVSVKSIIKEKGYYQVDVFDKTYKMEAVKWQGDTIVAHVKGKPKKELKFHEKDIQNLKVRQFSKGRSDALTVAAYASVGVGVFLLLK
ncbi:hypothetical protein [Faecalibacter macacae]|uniref:Lipoprotein n=1 Tax=Faecalibacter macacae TaxID=1859289 RepID=A0A3L9M9C7_9FLAO|nr:hypothetical protein [Faecalibacter macacae]RLZ09133.1 hypothetical protein EAH69_08965 [Faecalibacter macacae]